MPSNKTSYNHKNYNRKPEKLTDEEKWEYQLQRFRDRKQRLPDIIKLPRFDCFRYCPHNPVHHIKVCHAPHYIDKSYCTWCQEFIRVNWHQCDGDGEPLEEELILNLRNQKWSDLPAAFIAATDGIAERVYGHLNRVEVVEKLPQHSSYHEEPPIVWQHRLPKTPSQRQNVRNCTGYWDDCM
jgi:hypothetical protein